MMEIKMESNELTTHLSEEMISRLETGSDLGGMMSTEYFQQSSLYIDDQDDDESGADDVIILHMDIREPLRSLQKLIEQKIGVDLNGYVFWLQNAQVLEPHKNLVDQCVKGEGLVQINVQIQTISQRINIVDVLKPTEEVLAASAAEAVLQNSFSDEFENTNDDSKEETAAAPSVDKEPENKEQKPENKPAVTGISKEKPCLNWVLDSKFKKEQVRLKIPDDPNDWTVPQVKHWFQWAVRQFDLTDFIISDWSITGKELCSLTHEEFCKKLPIDPGNVFWTHLQLLKECKFVSVVHKVPESVVVEPTLTLNNARVLQGSLPIQLKEQKIMRKTALQNTKNLTLMITDGSPTHSIGSNGSGGSPYGVGSGNNGQVQLWQFLLEILTDREHVDIIQWVGIDGEFKLTDPERVARLWGEKKNKPAMNYEKLSRALRYYYDGDMISKVSGKRFAYKFDCDLKLLIGYDAAELSRLVSEKPLVDESVYLEQMNVPSDGE